MSWAGFAYPAVLLALVIPVLLLLWTWRRAGMRGEGALVLPLDHVGGGRGLGWRILTDGAQSLAPLVLAIAILILAGPQELGQPRRERELTNIEFCLDVSCSMMAEFGEKTRYDAAMKAINQFIDYREGDAFGLTIFGNAVLHWVPLTSDTSAFRCAPPFLRPENLPSWFGGTEIGKALVACAKVLVSRDEGDRMIVLVSDGYSWDLANGNDETIAAKLRADDITVYAVHVADGEPPGELVTITSATGGEVFAASDPSALEVVFKRIDAMQEVRLVSRAAEVQDAYGPFAYAGLGLLGLFLLVQLGLRYTPW